MNFTSLANTYLVCCKNPVYLKPKISKLWSNPFHKWKFRWCWIIIGIYF